MQYVTCEHEEKVKVQVMHRKYEFIVFVEHLELRLYYPQKSVYHGICLTYSVRTSRTTMIPYGVYKMYLLELI